LLVSHSPTISNLSRPSPRDTEPIASRNNPFKNVHAMATKSLVLVLCTGPSCHSHLAEGILRRASADLIEGSNADLKHKFKREVSE
jgi:hypothetical protein